MWHETALDIQKARKRLLDHVLISTSRIKDRTRETAEIEPTLFLAIIFSHFCVFFAEQWNHDVIASSKTGILPN